MRKMTKQQREEVKSRMIVKSEKSTPEDEGVKQDTVYQQTGSRSRKTAKEAMTVKK